MEIKVSQSTLLKALEIVTRISTKHVTLPVLQCVLIEATKDVVTLSATNLEIGVQIKLDATVEEVGTAAIPATTLSNTIQLLTEQTITMKVEGGSLTIETPQSETQIKLIAFEEFPTIPILSDGGQILNRVRFAEGIKAVAFAASQSSIKPELGSINIHQTKEHTLTFVATDSFRLMEKTVPQKGVVLDGALLIPYKNALEIARIADLLTTDPQLYVTENQCALCFVDEGVYLTSRLVAGTFPDYVQIIPKEYVTKSIVLRSDLIHALKRSNIFLNKFLQVTLTVTSNALTVTAQNGDVGATTQSIHAKTSGEELTLSFNHHYLVESLQYFGEDSLELHFAGIGRSLVVTGVSGSSIRYLVMPMRK